MKDNQQVKKSYNATAKGNTNRNKNLEKAREMHIAKAQEREDTFFEVLEKTQNEFTARKVAGFSNPVFCMKLKNDVVFKERYEEAKTWMVEKSREVIAKSLRQGDVETAKFCLKHYDKDAQTQQKIEHKVQKPLSWNDDELLEKSKTETVNSSFVN